MPRIRKKTTNRKTTNDRRKVQHKARESRKKKTKAAKKNTQWKSKNKKDPGIPNDFPYKDQILAEVAEQRRAAAEEKEKRKEEKRLARQQPKEDRTEDQNTADEGQESPGSKSLDVGSEAIASLSAKLINPKLTTKEKKSVVLVREEEEAPILVNHDLPTLKAVLDGSDVLLEVLDARDPLPFRSSYLEKAMEEKKVLLVLNKIDTCPRESLSAWLAFLRREHPTYLFRTATAFLPAALESTAPVQGKGKAKVSFPKDDALGSEAILAQLSSWAKEKDGSPLNVAVVGLTNAGKSSFLNSLLHKASLPVYSLPTSSRGATTTVLPQEVSIEADGKLIRFVDTPGLTWLNEATEAGADSIEDLRVRDILLRSKGRIDRLKDPSSAVIHIISRVNTEDLMLMYNIPAFTKGDSTAFLSGVARSNHLVKKRGEPDLTGASKIILRDWSTARFARYTTPPVIHESKQPDTSPLNEVDEKVLSSVRMRKEIRKDGGLVKLLASSMEKREVALEKPWIEEEKSDDSDIADGEMNADGDGDEEESGSDEDDGTGQDDEGSELDEQEEDEDTEPSPPPSKQKRKRATSSASMQLTKKVAFTSHNQSKPAQTSTERPQGQPGPKSILKKSTTTTRQNVSGPAPSKKQKRPPGKVANAPSSLKNKAGVADPNAYDFTKFF
ncbi:hypothetical protein P691DRAFT_759896 [Macrolepiota fuliginosa MF-IS2]|uniref:CP-type G domain-containing protein n=1 Tax=Macrolepiota fuliginosa MF-IS2 TaxID=1400762 RepID=A0A9P5XCH2_9AGAR|nr:hypothetical protein P691DRAFT_759896 [Macrolepiota fuliginosa MF-IS2]